MLSFVDNLELPSLQDPQLSPDGKTIYFTATDAKSADEREKERLQDDVYAFEETNFKQRHLWTTDLSGKIARVTEGDWSVGSYELSANGSRIAMTRTPSPLLEFLDRTEVWVMDASGANAKPLTNNKVPESGASLSPDGATVMFQSQANEQFDLYYNAKLFLVPAAGGPARVLLPDVPYGVEEAAWSADGQSNYFSPLKDVAKVKTPTHLYVAPREGHGWTELRHRLFKLQIEMEWFEKHIHSRTYTWENGAGGRESARKTDDHRRAKFFTRLNPCVEFRALEGSRAVSVRRKLDVPSPRS